MTPPTVSQRVNNIKPFISIENSIHHNREEKMIACPLDIQRLMWWNILGRTKKSLYAQKKESGDEQSAQSMKI